MEHAGTDDADIRYENAIRLCADGILQMLWGEKMINKIFGRATQSHAAGLAIVMHFEALEGLGRRPTLALIQAEMGRSRTLAAFFALLRWAGFLRIDVDPSDRRHQYLVPTDPLIAGVRAWMLHHVRCCEAMGMVRQGSADAFQVDAESFGALMARSRKLVERARTPIPGGEAWTWFDSFDCGDRIALLLLREHYTARALQASGDIRFALDSRDLAVHLGISHSHVRNVINRAEDRGLLHHDRRRHLTALSETMTDGIRVWFTSFWTSVAEVVSSADEARSSIPIARSCNANPPMATGVLEATIGRDGSLPAG